MAKYGPLTAFLAAAKTQEVLMSFGDIERVIGSPLPASKQYPAWWSNNPSNNVMTRAWLNAGFRTERVDPASERLVFRRAETGPQKEVEPARKSKPSFVEEFRARFGGVFTVRDGVDLTQPTGEIWDAQGE